MTGKLRPTAAQSWPLFSFRLAARLFLLDLIPVGFRTSLGQFLLRPLVTLLEPWLLSLLAALQNSGHPCPSNGIQGGLSVAFQRVQGGMARLVWHFKEKVLFSNKIIQYNLLYFSGDFSDEWFYGFGQIKKNT